MSNLFYRRRKLEHDRQSLSLVLFAASALVGLLRRLEPWIEELSALLYRERGNLT